MVGLMHAEVRHETAAQRFEDKQRLWMPALNLGQQVLLYFGKVAALGARQLPFQVDHFADTTVPLADAQVLVGSAIIEGHARRAGGKKMDFGTLRPCFHTSCELLQ